MLAHAVKYSAVKSCRKLVYSAAKSFVSTLPKALKMTAKANFEAFHTRTYCTMFAGQAFSVYSISNIGFRQMIKCNCGGALQPAGSV